MTKKPNFFIVGAPKCGTTAMYSYLKAHPDIFMPEAKEPYFFGSDLIYRMPRMTIEQYSALFNGAKKQKKIGEASVTYLCSKKAAQEIKEFNPSAKIIVMLRNPVEMMYSLHSQCLFTGTEDIKDFESALSAEADRKRNLRIPSTCKDIVNYIFYRDIAKYTEQVVRYFQAFGRENIHFIIFDDFKRDVALSYRDTLSFLDVDSSFRPSSFEIVNPSKRFRSRSILSFFNHPAIVRSVRFLIPVYEWRQLIAKKINSFNIEHSHRTAMNQELKLQLQKEFYPEIEQLSALLKRDLTHWCRII